MTEIRFYHMERSNLAQTLPALISKAYEKGHKIIVKTASESEAEKLNEHLWTYNPNSFLPHGSKKDAHAENQPIWLTADDENPNNADVLILTQGTQSNNLKDFALICEMLNGHDEDAVKAARAQWKTYKEDGFDVTYWQQSPNGAWEKKS